MRVMIRYKNGTLGWEYEAEGSYGFLGRKMCWGFSNSSWEEAKANLLQQILKKKERKELPVPPPPETTDTSLWTLGPRVEGEGK